MIRRSTHEERNRAPPTGDLAELLATEKRLADELASARTAADVLVAEARRRADSSAPPARDDLEALLAALVEEEAGELRHIAVELERRLARHAEADGPRLGELVDLVIALVVASVRPEVPP